MKSTALALFCSVVFFALSFSPQGSADSGIPTTFPSSNQLTEGQSELLEKLKTASTMQQRAAVIYVSGIGATRFVKRAIQDGMVSPDTKFEYTLLTSAATNGHLETVKMLIGIGANIELKDKWQDSPLKAAARAGHLDIVTYLLSKGANPDSEGKSGSTPLTSASYIGRIDIVKALLKGGATVKSNKARWTLIHYAAKYGHSKLIDCLLYTSPSPRDATLSRMPSSA